MNGSTRGIFFHFCGSQVTHMPLLAMVPLFLRLQENIALCRSFVCYFRSFFMLRQFVSCVMYCFDEVCTWLSKPHCRQKSNLWTVCLCCYYHYYYLLTFLLLMLLVSVYSDVLLLLLFFLFFLILFPPLLALLLFYFLFLFFLCSSSCWYCLSSSSSHFYSSPLFYLFFSLFFFFIFFWGGWKKSSLAFLVVLSAQYLIRQFCNKAHFLLIMCYCNCGCLHIDIHAVCCFSNVFGGLARLTFGKFGKSQLMSYYHYH